MTISFENDNDIIVYAFEKIISFARQKQYIFVVQCVWWLAACTGIEHGLINHIETLQSRTRAKKEPVVVYSTGNDFHSERRQYIDISEPSDSE